jgi:hypothetical protein
MSKNEILILGSLRGRIEPGLLEVIPISVYGDTGKEPFKKRRRLIEFVLRNGERVCSYCETPESQETKWKCCDL